MLITNVNRNQLGYSLGLKSGDRLLRINGRKVMDELDYQFRIAEENLFLEFEISGKTVKFEVEKDFDEDLGVEFEELKIRKCANDCVFCFVDQNPKGLRDGIYFRDGDYRLSFLYGHYITLTNIGKNELNRIVEQRMSPLYISVHTTDPELRKKLLLYKKNDSFMDKIDFLVKNEIELHCQIVLIPMENDGKHLLRTIMDLYQYYPMIKSLSIVPVGLTEHREGLMELNTVDYQYAKNFIPKVKTYKKKFPGSNCSFFFLSDEWYILAKEAIPKSEEYGKFDLIENGVGQVRNFLNIFENEKKQISHIAKLHKLNFTIGCGILIYPIFLKYLSPFFNSEPNLNIRIIPIYNNFFGKTVTVSGLLSGKDIIQQLSGRDLGNTVWFSNRILNDDQTLTIDDFTLNDISNKINCNVKVSDDSILSIVREEIKY
ncbi:MAG: DUF512 domain-containing protein [Candidatus Neomarinimicrobiota bacterium]|jgi:putative radical SAM enzyme (TIGR03279 family)|nr:DUF512 domain-containing protein [Candidatus Neomarinimicrobiota bacterium]